MVLLPAGRPCAPPRRRWWLLAVALAAAWWATGLVGAHLLTRAHPRAMPPAGELRGRAAEDVAVRTDDGLVVRGWLVRERPGSARCVLLAAGIRGTRLAMAERAEWYLARGWSVLLADLRGTGASGGERITMGWHEARDLRAWSAWLAAEGFAEVGVHGQSLGAAAAVYAAARPGGVAWRFVVLESCYADVHEALAARLPLLPAFTTWPLVVCCEWLAGVDAAELAPGRAIARLRAPTLLVQGDADDQTGPDALARLFAACGAGRKQRYDVPGAGHVDLWRVGGDGFRRALSAFLAGL